MLGDLQEGSNYFEFGLAIWQKVLSHDNSNTKLKILWFRSSLRILQLILQQTVAVSRQGRKPPVCPSFCVCVHKYLLLTSAGKERLNTWFAWPHGNQTVCNPFFPLLWLLGMASCYACDTVKLDTSNATLTAGNHLGPMFADKTDTHLLTLHIHRLVLPWFCYVSSCLS